jgi:CspA family cold shock protein
MPTGTVKWFNETKGFGFIKPDDGGADLFAHYSGIKSKGFRTLKENQRVEYQVQQGQKGPQAVEINASPDRAIPPGPRCGPFLVRLRRRRPPVERRAAVRLLSWVEGLARLESAPFP